MEAVDIQQLESFEAGCLFAQSEGIIPAPESSHAIAAAIREANKCKETGEEKVILFNLSGHGLIDMTSYDKYLAGDLVNYSDGFSGFRDYTNFHRLQYFKEQARLQKNLTVKELMFLSGFTSRSSFYRYFASVEKMSPSEYMEMLN